MVGDKLAKTEGAGDESTPANLSTADVKVSQNTLTPADLMPVWRGSRQRDKGRSERNRLPRGTSARYMAAMFRLWPFAAAQPI